MTGFPTRRHVEDDLKAYIDGELGTLRRLTIARHLAACERCREKEQEMKRITEQLNGWGGAKNTALSPDLRATLLAQAPTGRGADTPAHVPLWRRSPGLVFGGGGLSLAASFAAFAFLYGTANQQTLEAPAASVATAVSVEGEVAAAASRPVPQPGVATESAPAAEAANVDKVTETEANRGVAPSDFASPSGGTVRAGVATARQGRSNSDEWPSMYRAQRVRQPEAKTVIAAGEAPPTGDISDRNTSLSIDARQVHREASLGVAVENPEAASAKVETLVKEWGGYVASNILTTDDSGYKSADLTLKVPEERFDEMLTSLGKMGDIRSKNITGEDITEQTSDATSDEQVLIDETAKLESRLKAGQLSDRRTMQTEAQLRQVRQQMARTQARLGLLRKLARLSTLNVSLTEKKKVEVGAAPTSGFWYDLKDSNRSALKAFQAAVRVPLLLAIWMVALSPLWLPLLLVYRHLSRRQALAQIAEQAQAATKVTPTTENVTNFDR